MLAEVRRDDCLGNKGAFQMTDTTPVDYEMRGYHVEDRVTDAAEFRFGNKATGQVTNSTWDEVYFHCKSRVMNLVLGEIVRATQ